MSRCQSDFFRGRKPSKRHQPAILMTSSEASAFLGGVSIIPDAFPYWDSAGSNSRRNIVVLVLYSA